MSLCKPKSLNFLRTLDIAPTKKSNPPISLLIIDYILWKKASVIAFRLILPKFFSAACILSYTIMTYLKNLDGTNSINTKQCPTRLSPRIIPQVSLFLPKMLPLLMLLCCTYHMWRSPPFLEEVSMKKTGHFFKTVKFWFVQKDRHHCESLTTLTSSKQDLNPSRTWFQAFLNEVVQ